MGCTVGAFACWNVGSQPAEALSHAWAVVEGAAEDAGRRGGTRQLVGGLRGACRRWGCTLGRMAGVEHARLE
jgi:hypothetical protein